MKTAVWIIAVCELVRATQNAAQLVMLHRDSGARENAYAEFVKSLKSSDKEYVEQMLKEFEKGHENEN